MNQIATDAPWRFWSRRSQKKEMSKFPYSIIVIIYLLNKQKEQTKCWHCLPCAGKKPETSLVHAGPEATHTYM